MNGSQRLRLAGETILTLLPKGGVWFGFNLREDKLAALAIGAQVPVERAGAANAVPGIVTELYNRGEFATWRAARASGDHDLNTFFIRVDPVAPDPTFAPGETVWLNVKPGP